MSFLDNVASDQRYYIVRSSNVATCISILNYTTFCFECKSFWGTPFMVAELQNEQQHINNNLLSRCEIHVYKYHVSIFYLLPSCIAANQQEQQQKETHTENCCCFIYIQPETKFSPGP